MVLKSHLVEGFMTTLIKFHHYQVFYYSLGMADIRQRMLRILTAAKL